MKQKQIRTVVAALHHADIAITGAKAYGASIGLIHNTEAKIATERALLAAADQELCDLRQILNERQATFRAAFGNVLAFLATGRDVLKTPLGNHYNPNWDGTGFRNSLAMPRSITDASFMIENLASYLARVPAHENRDLDITAIRGMALFNQFRAARLALAAQQTQVDASNRRRDACFIMLRNRLRSLFKELVLLLHPLDGHFLSFGFYKPGAVAMPDEPENVVVEQVAPGRMGVKWSRAPRAERYRVWIRDRTNNSEPVIIDTRNELDITLENIAWSEGLELSVSAINQGGESARVTAVLKPFPSTKGGIT